MWARPLGSKATESKAPMLYYWYLVTPPGILLFSAHDGCSGWFEFLGAQNIKIPGDVVKLKYCMIRVRRASNSSPSGHRQQPAKFGSQQEFTLGTVVEQNINIEIKVELEGSDIFPIPNIYFLSKSGHEYQAEKSYIIMGKTPSAKPGFREIRSFSSKLGILNQKEPNARFFHIFIPKCSQLYI